MIDELQPKTGWSKIRANLGYGWESLDFYRTWGGTDSDPREAKGPYLDRSTPKRCIPLPFRICFQVLPQSPDYVERLGCSSSPHSEKLAAVIA